MSQRTEPVTATTKTSLPSDASCEVEFVHPDAVRRVREQLPDEESLQRVAAVFQVLADPTRAGIVYALALEELCVCDVAAVARLSVSAASHQLKRLRDQGIVRYRKDGRMAFYRLSDPHIQHLIEEGVRRVREEQSPPVAEVQPAGAR